MLDKGYLFTTQKPKRQEICVVNSSLENLKSRIRFLLPSSAHKIYEIHGRKYTDLQPDRDQKKHGLGHGSEAFLFKIKVELSIVVG